MTSTHGGARDASRIPSNISEVAVSPFNERGPTQQPRSAAPRMNGDPYIMDERDPLNSCAMESSLWEIQSLQNHILPSIATAARFINSPLPSVEWDLTKILEQTPDDIFVRELKKKAKEIALTFDKPTSMEVPGGERLTHYWNF